MKNITRHLKSLKTRLQVNQYYLYPEERENSEWKQILWDTQ